MTVAIVRTEAAGRMESRKPALRGEYIKMSRGYPRTA